MIIIIYVSSHDCLTLLTEWPLKTKWKVKNRVEQIKVSLCLCLSHCALCWQSLTQHFLFFCRKVEDLQFRVEEESITKGDLEVFIFIIYYTLLPSKYLTGASWSFHLIGLSFLNWSSLPLTLIWPSDSSAVRCAPYFSRGLCTTSGLCSYPLDIMLTGFSI